MSIQETFLKYKNRREDLKTQIAKLQKDLKSDIPESQRREINEEILKLSKKLDLTKLAMVFIQGATRNERLE